MCRTPRRSSLPRSDRRLRSIVGSDLPTAGLERGDVVRQSVGDLDRGIEVIELGRRPAFGHPEPGRPAEKLSGDRLAAERLSPLPLRCDELRERRLVEGHFGVLGVEADLEHWPTVSAQELTLVVLAVGFLEPDLQPSTVHRGAQLTELRGDGSGECIEDLFEEEGLHTMTLLAALPRVDLKERRIAHVATRSTWKWCGECQVSTELNDA